MLNIKRSAKTKGNHYENSTQQWLPIKNIVKGMVQLKDGRLVKIVEIMPVNFYLKSEVEQENIIYYFASYLKIAPDNLQIRVLTQRADIEEYLRRLQEFHTNEQNELCREMINGEMEFVRTLSENTAVKKRFFIVYEYSQGAMGNANAGINDVIRNTHSILSDKMTIKEEIETLVTANKFEQNIMIVMPVALIALIKFSSPDFAANFTTTTGIISTTIAVALFVVSYFIGRKILKIKV